MRKIIYNFILNQEAAAKNATIGPLAGIESANLLKRSNQLSPVVEL